MILSIASSLATFKSLAFHPGLNVLLADTVPGATDKQTRNSAGKTSFVEIIHFLLGANCDPDSLFRVPELINETFSGVFEIAGKQLRVERSGAAPAKIFVEGLDSNLGVPQKTDKASRRKYVSNANWRVYLGHAMFGLPADPDGSAYDTADAPSFRSLISYFARRKSADGMAHPERHAAMQQRADWQVNCPICSASTGRCHRRFKASATGRRRSKSCEKRRRVGL